MGYLMDMLRASRPVFQLTQVQPQQATVEKTQFKAGMVARQPGVNEGLSLHATTAILSAPVYGSTNPGAFVQISGAPPIAPVVGHVSPILGSNAPTGGNN